MPNQQPVAHQEDRHRFALHSPAGLAQLVYRRAGDVITLLHTEVPSELQGRGIASQLAKAALDFARAQHLRVIPQCPFVAEYINRHAAYRDLVS